MAVSGNWSPGRDRRKWGLETSLAPCPGNFGLKNLDKLFLQRLRIGRGQRVLPPCSPILIIQLCHKTAFSSLSLKIQGFILYNIYTFLVYFVPFPWCFAWQSCLGWKPPPSCCSKRQRKQMGGGILFYPILIKQQGRSWMPHDMQQNPKELEAVPVLWPPFHICFCMHLSIKASGKALESPFPAKNVARKWGRSSTLFLLALPHGFDPCSHGNISTSWIRTASHYLPCSGTCVKMGFKLPHPYRRVVTADRSLRLILSHSWKRKACLHICISFFPAALSSLVCTCSFLEVFLYFLVRGMRVLNHSSGVAAWFSRTKPCRYCLWI